MTAIEFISKGGKQISIKSSGILQNAQPFAFECKPHESPYSVFGAYVKLNNSVKICHIGCEIGGDW